MSEVLVSVGVPVYNEELHLEQALASVLAQTHTNLEILVVDNCSTDGTRAIAEACARRDSRVRYVRNEANLGSVGNFQKAFDLSSGEFFLWVSGHDLRVPTYVEECLALLASHKDVVLAYPRARYIENSGEPVGLIPGYFDTRGLSRRMRFRLILDELGYGYPTYGVYRSSALRKVPLTRSTVGADVILLSELALLGSFAVVHKPLLDMRLLAEFGDWEAYLARVMGKSSRRPTLELFWEMLTLWVAAAARHGHSRGERLWIAGRVIETMLIRYLWTFLVNSRVLRFFWEPLRRVLRGPRTSRPVPRPAYEPLPDAPG